VNGVLHTARARGEAGQAAYLGLSNALDKRELARRNGIFEAGAPPGPRHNQHTRGPVQPALGILGGSQMTHQ
jgi:hypothetical protein